MRVQWRCKKQASVLFGITTKISPSTFISFVIRAAKVKVTALILAFEWYRKCLTRKGYFWDPEFGQNTVRDSGKRKIS